MSLRTTGTKCARLTLTQKTIRGARVVPILKLLPPAKVARAAGILDAKHPIELLNGFKIFQETRALLTRFAAYFARGHLDADAPSGGYRSACTL